MGALCQNKSCSLLSLFTLKLKVKISFQKAVPRSVVRCPPFPKQFCGKDLTSSLLLGEGIGKRGGPQGHQDVRASRKYTHKRFKTLYWCVKKCLHCNFINEYYIHIFIYINRYTYTDNKGLILW